jgi:hypothetical protein
MATALIEGKAVTIGAMEELLAKTGALLLERLLAGLNRTAGAALYS